MPAPFRRPPLARLASRFAPILAAATTLVGCGPQPTAPRPPDVVLIVLDTLRPDHLGCYGYERDTSPHLDALARDGVIFENAQSPAPWTAPSVASLLTSLYPDVHGVTEHPRAGSLPLAAPTLAERLSERGYTTAAFTEGGYVKAAFGLDRGFDLFQDQAGDGAGFMGNLHHPSRLRANVDRAREWLAARDAAPFFLFFHTYEVHSPLRAPEEFIRFFRPGFDDADHRARLRETILVWNARRELDRAGARVLRAEAFYRALEGAPAIEDREALMVAGEALGEPLHKRNAAGDADLVAWARDLYDAEVRYTDAQLARLWQALEATRTATGGLDNTILILVSDHGEGLGDHGTMGHGINLHESLLRTVLIVRAPGLLDPSSVAQGRRVQEVVSLVDVMPTVLELIGSDAEASAVQGTSLVPLLRGEAISNPRQAFGQASHGISAPADGDRPAATFHAPDARSIRAGPWRLILNGPDGVPQLFRLPQDPQELTNLAGTHPAVVTELTEALERQARLDSAWRAQLESPAPDPLLDEQTLEELRHLGYMGDE
jgi:arylsulfatase A-like enzyme